MSIYKKLLEAKKEMNAITKDSKNPFFKSKYFDVNKLLSEVEPILQNHGLLLLQPIEEMRVYSIIIDADGQGTDRERRVQSFISLPNIQDPQKLGSAITYFRRYTLQSLLGLQAEDDDASSASKHVNNSKPKLLDEQLKNALNVGTKEQIKKALVVYELTKEQREKLENHLKTL